MVLRIRKAIGVLGIAALVAAAPLGAGCGNSGQDRSERAVEWSINRVNGPKSIRLVAMVEVCVKPVQLEEPIIEYSGHRVYIEFRHTPEEGEGEHGGCPLMGPLPLHKTVTLKQDLDELVLYDAGTDPPEQRWPTQGPLPTE